MLNSMYCTIMQYRLSVGLFHSDIKSGDCFVADTIFAANVNTTKKRFVIYCKTRYLVHNYLFIYSVNKTLSDFKTSFSHTIPKIKIHLCFVVIKWNITYNSEADKRSIEYMACLSNAATFHIYCSRIRELIHDLFHLFLAVDKPFSADSKSFLNFKFTVI